jgi:hypothetical protein
VFHEEARPHPGPVVGDGVAEQHDSGPCGIHEVFVGLRISFKVQDFLSNVSTLFQVYHLQHRSSHTYL